MIRGQRNLTAIENENEDEDENEHERELHEMRSSEGNTVNELHSYLNDHLAGSIAALELLDRLIEAEQRNEREGFFRTLRDEIQADHETLKEIMGKVGAKESRIKNAGAWLMEKLSRPKLSVNEKDEDEKALGLFLALETLALGIVGKRLLWRALRAASETTPLLQGPDYTRLEERALDQRVRVETERLEIARRVFDGAKG